MRVWGLSLVVSPVGFRDRSPEKQVAGLFSLLGPLNPKPSTLYLVIRINILGSAYLEPNTYVRRCKCAQPACNLVYTDQNYFLK